MARLEADYTSAFRRDVKRLQRKHADMTELKNVIRLVLENTEESKEILRVRHRAHRLKGKDWQGVVECHVGNAGDWLAVWVREDSFAVFMRTGTHEEIFGG